VDGGDDRERGQRHAGDHGEGVDLRTRRRPRRSALFRLVAKFLRSRTVWVALAQAGVMTFAAISSVNPAFAHLAWVIVGKSFFDIWMRYLTTTPIGEGQP
jgi:hypothetical protein